MNAPQRASWRLVLLGNLVVFVSACSSGGSSAPPVIPSPAISRQPGNQSVPMGLTATFSVVASGSALQYQWLKDSVEITGATANSYVTPSTSSPDNGSSYSVVVTNAGGAVRSSAAMLTVTARAPAPGDLRFQQVDAPGTVNGWSVVSAVNTNVDGRGAVFYSPAIGTPLYVGAGDCVAPAANDGTGCSWLYSVFAVSTPGVTTAYGGDLYDNFASDLQTGATGLLTFADSGIAPTSPNSVIHSLDIEQASDLFGLSWFQSSQQTGFVLAQNTVAPTDLQAAAVGEGAAGRVITAISANNARVTYFAYAWQADTASVYEAQIVTASSADAPNAAAQLASEGYIITATGLADGTGDILLVGTRVLGDTMPRPFMSASGAQVRTLQQQGYAIVGVIFNAALNDPYTFLGER
ncbi:MAG TPA: hypothetical protein VNZ06_11215 [Steroidobacteraceae bacterium]|nr:hypothetical protein [Steroidobacteraceae bacterium]